MGHFSGKGDAARRDTLVMTVEYIQHVFIHMKVESQITYRFASDRKC